MLPQILDPSSSKCSWEKSGNNMLAHMPDTRAHRHIPTELAHSTDAAIYGQEKYYRLPEMDTSFHAFTTTPAKSKFVGSPLGKAVATQYKVC